MVERKARTKGTISTQLSKDDRKDDDKKDDTKNHEQTACPVACILLISAGTAQLDVGAPGVLSDVLDILTDDIQLASLFGDDVRNISEQLIQLSHTLFNVPDLCLTLDNKGLLEVHLALVGHTTLFLQLLLL